MLLYGLYFTQFNGDISAYDVKQIIKGKFQIDEEATPEYCEFGDLAIYAKDNGLEIGLITNHDDYVEDVVVGLKTDGSFDSLKEVHEIAIKKFHHNAVEDLMVALNRKPAERTLKVYHID